MKIRFLVISLLLGCQLLAFAQNCSEKCRTICTQTFTDHKQIIACEKDCTARCLNPDSSPPGQGLGAMDALPHRFNALGATTAGALPDRQWDDNGYLRNPVWRVSKPFPCGACPCLDNPDDAADLWRSLPLCTGQFLHTNSNSVCSLPNSALPTEFIQPTGSGISYHLNWFPVEYEGMLGWDGHTNWISDNEYSFNIFRNDQALETAERSGVHVEFNSTETVDNFDNAKTTWWYNFHHNVVDLVDDTGIKGYLGRYGDPGPFAIVIGMLGLDLAHIDHHSELHPVYAMFLKLKESPTKDQWAFFVRNWGVEGFCGPGDEPLNEKTIRVRIQHKGSANAVLSPNVYTYSHNNNDQCSQNNWSFEPTEDGVLLTFDLSDASNKCGFVGDLSIDWKVSDDTSLSSQPILSPATPPPVRPPSNASNPALSPSLAKLSPSARQQLSKNLAAATGKPTARRKKPSKPSAPWHPPEPPTGLPNYGKGLKAVPNPGLQAKEAKKREVIETFLKAHGIQ